MSTLRWNLWPRMLSLRITSLWRNLSWQTYLYHTSLWAFATSITLFNLSLTYSTGAHTVIYCVREWALSYHWLYIWRKGIFCLPQTNATPTQKAFIHFQVTVQYACCTCNLQVSLLPLNSTRQALGEGAFLLFWFFLIFISLLFWKTYSLRSDLAASNKQLTKQWQKTDNLHRGLLSA